MLAREARLSLRYSDNSGQFGDLATSYRNGATRTRTAGSAIDAPRGTTSPRFTPLALALITALAGAACGRTVTPPTAPCGPAKVDTLRGPSGQILSIVITPPRGCR